MHKINQRHILKGLEGLTLQPWLNTSLNSNTNYSLSDMFSGEKPLIESWRFGYTPLIELSTPNLSSTFSQNLSFTDRLNNQINDRFKTLAEQELSKDKAINPEDLAPLNVIPLDPQKLQNFQSGLGLGITAANAVGKAVMGDKNFGVASDAVDLGVHMASSALMTSGNPYAMAAGAALEAGNFITKATGQTVEGFDVNIDSSGYGNLGHYDSKSNRDWLSAIGLGGIFNRGRLDNLMKRRNDAAIMAMKASLISDTEQFKKEASLNSIDDKQRSNTIALDGGFNSSLIASKHGSKLLKLEAFRQELLKLKAATSVIAEKSDIQKAKNGAKLKHIETSEEPNVIPSGTLHKNKHADFDLDVTKKGIPVVTVQDDSVETLEEIQEQKDTLIQHAEVEKEEIILEKNLTEFIEESKKEWDNSKDDDICIKVGMRFVKELLFNTEDNTNTIKTTKNKENELNK